MSGRTLLLAALCVGLAGAHSGSEAAKKVRFLEPKKGPPAPDVAQLVDAENAFCKLALSAGIRDAFYANLAENGIIFRPGPINGKQFFKDRPSNAVPQLSWEANYAEISGSGDLGWTTGPWEFRPEKGKPAVAYGHFATVWQKQADGTWRAVIDQGHECPLTRPVSFMSARLGGGEPGAAPPLTAADAAASRKALMEADDAYSKVLVSTGIGDALNASATLDVRIYRDGTPPVQGPANAGRMFSGEWDAMIANWHMQPGVISQAGDLAFTYGVVDLAKYDGTQVKRSAYRVWRRARGGPWKLALDVTNLMAPPPPPPAPKS